MRTGIDCDRYAPLLLDRDWKEDEEIFNPEIELVISSIKALEKLDRGWDGDKAPPIDRRYIRAAIELVRGLDSFPRMPHVAPTLDGRVGFEWHWNINNVLLLEVETPDEIGFSYCIDDGKLDGDGTFPIQDHASAQKLLNDILMR